MARKLLGSAPSGATDAATKDYVDKWPVMIPISVGDETTNITAGTNKLKFRLPCPRAAGFKLLNIYGSLTAAQPSGGTLLTVDVNEAGTSLLSTKLTFDNTELTTKTAATPVVISDSDVAEDAEWSVDVDAIGDAGAKGLKLYLWGYFK